MGIFGSIFDGDSRSSGGLLSDLTAAATRESSYPATNRFTIYESLAGDILSYNWITSTSTNHGATAGALTTAITTAIAALTASRTAYESIRVVADGWTITSQIVVDDWTDLVIEGALTAATGLNEYVIYGDGVSHVRLRGKGSINHDYTNQTAGGCIQFERSSNIYIDGLTLLNAYQESVEFKTVDNAYVVGVTADDYGDDAFSILDCNRVLLQRNYATGGRNDTGGTGTYEFEDGSHHCVAIDNIADTINGDGMHIIVDPNSNHTITAITEIGGGVYRATVSTSVTSFSIGKDAYLTGGGVWDGTWPVSDVDFSVGTWFEFDMGAANAGLGSDASSPATDDAEYSAGVLHDIYIYNHTVTNTTNTAGGAGTPTGLGISSTCNTTEYGSALKRRNYNIFIDGLAVSNITGNAVSFGNTINSSIKNVRGSGLNTSSVDGIILNQCRYNTIENCHVEHFGKHGIYLYRSLDTTVLNCSAHDVSEANASTFGFGIQIDPNLFDWDLQTLTASATQTNLTTVTNFESFKRNWNPVGAANFRGGVGVDDCSGVVTTKVAINYYSAGTTIYYTGGATSGNNSSSGVIGFDQP